MTGPAGIAADLDQVADEAGETLLIATLGLVLVLLLVVYRAPVLALLPLIAVGAAYLVAIGIAYLLIEAGWIIVNTEGTFLLLVLVFGAGTDYSLLLVHRYREELTAAAARAGAAAGLRETRPGDRRIRRDGDRGDAGPAGRRPAVDPLARPDPGDRDRGDARCSPSPSSPLCWRCSASAPSGPARARRERRGRGALGAGRGARPSAARGRSSRSSSPGCSSSRSATSSTTARSASARARPEPTNSGRGTKVLNEHFPPGLGSPLTAVVPAARRPQVVAGMKHLDAVRLAVPVPADREPRGGRRRSSSPATPTPARRPTRSSEIRERLHAITPRGLLGGIPAENYDIEQTNARDTRLIVPLVLLVVGLILAAVLRALVAPPT